MKRNSVFVLVSLLALTVAGCTSSPKKKSKKSSSPSSSTSLTSSATSSSKSSSSSGTTSSSSTTSSQDPTSSKTQSGSSATSSSVASTSSIAPTSSIRPTSSVAPTSSVKPTSSVTTTTSTSSPTSTGSTLTGSGSITPAPTGDTDYTYCEEAYKNGSASQLLTQIRDVAKNCHPGSYGDLWTIYNKVYVRDDGYMFDYYSNVTNFEPGTDQDGGSHSKEGDTYNREHSIPKSWWGGNTSSGTQGCDPFIVVPSDSVINGMRSNYAMGYVDYVQSSSKNNFSKLGPGKASYGYTGIVFEPDDSVKGDFARIVMYAIAAYQDSYDWTSDDGYYVFSGSPTKGFGLTDYAIRLYSEWSNLDPVSAWEKKINNLLEPINHTRNPFIDHPEYANKLWGDNSNYTMYNH